MRLLKRLKGNDFWKNVFTLLSASMLAQAIPFFVLPVLQKYFYTPAQFGELAIFSSVSILLASVAAFKYELAVVGAESEDEAASVFQLGFIGITFSTAIVSFFVLYYSSWFAELLGASDIQKYLLWIPVSVFLVAFIDLINYWNNMKKEYKKMGASKLVKAVSAETLKLSLGKVKLSGGLIYGRIFGELMTLIFLLVKLARSDYKEFVAVKSKQLWPSVKKHYRFPVYSMPSVFVGNFINVVFLTLFTRYFGEANTGIIGISVLYVSAAFGLVAYSFSQVFYKEIQDVKGKENLWRIYLKNVKILSVLSLFVVVIVLVIPSSWVELFLGAQWSDMMPVLKILVFAYSVMFVSSSVSFIYIRLNKQSVMLWFDILHLLMVAGSIYFGYRQLGTFFGTLICYSVAQIIYYLIAICAALIFIKKSDE